MKFSAVPVVFNNVLCSLQSMISTNGYISRSLNEGRQFILFQTRAEAFPHKQAAHSTTTPVHICLAGRRICLWGPRLELIHKTHRVHLQQAALTHVVCWFSTSDSELSDRLEPGGGRQWPQRRGCDSSIPAAANERAPFLSHIQHE